jgi:hypothetical protein
MSSGEVVRGRPASPQFLEMQAKVKDANRKDREDRRVHREIEAAARVVVQFESSALASLWLDSFPQIEVPAWA